MIQMAVGVIELIAALAIALIFLKVAASTKETEEYKRVTERGYAVRAKYFKTLLVVSIVLIAVSLFYLPYPRFAKGGFAVDEGKIFKVQAGQFYFEITDENGNDVEQIPMGKVRFDVTGVDVNHGFGIYTPGGVIIANVQMMPDYINKLYVEFDEPGTYTVWCMEYCGLAHHEMMIEFEVI